MANFFSKKILIWRETDKGVTPATIAKAFAVKMLNFSLAESQKKETNPLLGNGGQAPSTDFGSSDFAGNLECKYTGAIMPVILTHTIGSATKTDAATDGTWTTATVYTAGDIVNNVAGTKSLYCKTGGTSGATEPTLTGLSDGATVTDGTVTWVFRDAVLKKYVGSLTPCLETIGCEIQSETGCGGSVEYFKERFNGLFINSFEIAKAAGTIIYKYSLPMVGMNKTDSTQSGFTPLTITSEVSLSDNAFGFDDLEVKVGGVVPDSARSFRLTVNRNTALEDALKVGQKVDNTPIPTVDGELVMKFTLAQYTEAYNNSSKEVVLTFSKTNGDKVVLTLSKVELHRSPATYSTNEPIYITIPLNATGDENTATVSYECISTTDY